MASRSSQETVSGVIWAVDVNRSAVPWDGETDCVCAAIHSKCINLFAEHGLKPQMCHMNIGSDSLALGVCDFVKIRSDGTGSGTRSFGIPWLERWIYLIERMLEVSQAILESSKKSHRVFCFAANTTLFSIGTRRIKYGSEDA